MVDVEPGLGLSQLLGVSTYRIRTEIERFFPEEGVEGSLASTVVSTVVEGEAPDDVAVHVRRAWTDPEGSEVFEYMIVDGQTFVRGEETEWQDASDSDLFGHGPDPTPILYSSIHGYSRHLYASPVIGESEWLGNEEIDEVPVGRYQWSRPDDDSTGPHDVVSEGEFWVDASGVVRRVRSSAYQNEMLLFTQDAQLLDVGADIKIESPEIP